ncbi:MAG TPA: hypothetical protein VFH94_11340, partial [Streptomyces sp.]|nr:hypothetical protein [Streptomyces sp.]
PPEDQVTGGAERQRKSPEFARMGGTGGKPWCSSDTHTDADAGSGPIGRVARIDQMRTPNWKVPM